MTLFLVGYYEGELPFGPFWSEDFTAKIDQLSSQMRRKLSFAKNLQEVLNSCESKNNWRWYVSYKEAMGYFLVHRGTVIEVGKLLDIDMNDHDVTKTHIVQIAPGFLWHWPGDRTPSESQLMGLALDTIRAGHLEIENHHPEFECANAGLVDIHKLFTDRVCVHLQKDPKDEKTVGILMLILFLWYTEMSGSNLVTGTMTNIYIQHWSMLQLKLKIDLVNNRVITLDRVLGNTLSNKWPVIWYGFCSRPVE